MRVAREKTCDKMVIWKVDSVRRGLFYMFSNKNLKKGAAVVEFAFVLPFLVILLYGIIEFGLILYNQQVITNASREGARAGIAHASVSDIENIVDNYCLGRLIRFDTEINPSTTVTGPLGSPGDDLTVVVTYDYTLMFSDLLGFGPNFTLNAQTLMKMENVAGP